MDIILIAIILFFGFWGMKAGLVRSIFHLVRYIASMLLAVMLYPILQSVLLKTPLPDFISKTWVAPFVASNTNLDQLPAFLRKIAENAGAGITQALTSTAVSILSMVLLFIVVSILLKALPVMLDFFTRLPVINLLNKAGGFLVGIAAALLLIYLALAIQSVILNRTVFELISSSELAKIMYNDNIVLKLMMGGSFK